MPNDVNDVEALVTAGYSALAAGERAAARDSLQRAEGELAHEAVQQLKQVLASYDTAARQLGGG